MEMKLTSKRKTKSNHYLALFAKDVQNGCTYFYWARVNKGTIIWARMQSEDQLTEQIITDKEIRADQLPAAFINYIQHIWDYENKRN